MSILFWNVLKVAPVIAGASLITTSSTLAQTATTSEITTTNALEKTLEQINRYSFQESSLSMSQVTNVNQLQDVSPTDWAYEALRSLVDRYGCIVGYPNQIYRGNQALSRYEFAVGLNSCLNQIERLIASQGGVDQKTLDTIARLTQEFKAELATLGGRVDELEGRVAFLKDSQFSTTTKLEGQVIFAASAGGFTNERIINATGTEITLQQPNATTFYRVLLDLNTSFSGQDLLKLRIDTVSGLGNDNASGFLEPNFGSVLEFSVRGTPNQDFGLSRAYYSFVPNEDVRLSLGPLISVTDYVDFNSYANGVFDFGTLALVNNYILFPVDVPAAGAVIEWNPERGPFKLQGVYLAVDAANPNSNSRTANVPPLANLLYPNGDGNGGLFGNYLTKSNIIFVLENR